MSYPPPPGGAPPPTAYPSYPGYPPPAGSPQPGYPGAPAPAPGYGAPPPAHGSPYPPPASAPGAYPPPPASPSAYPAYPSAYPAPGAPHAHSMPPGSMPLPQPAPYGAPAHGHSMPPGQLPAAGAPYGGYPPPPGSPSGYPPPGAPAPHGYGAPPPQPGGYPGAPPPQGYGGHTPPPPGHGAYNPGAAYYGAAGVAAGAAVAGAHGQAVHAQGTVKPVANFNPDADAQALRKAMKGFGTDETALINILCKRTNAQRQEIKQRYKTLLGRDLVKDVESETSGNFMRTLVALMQTPLMYDVDEIWDALKEARGAALIEIFVNRSKQELTAIKAAYEKKTRNTLEKEIKVVFSGDFERGLLALLECRRDDEFQPLNMDRVTGDAQNLYKAGEKKIGTDEKMFIATLCYRSFAHIRAVCTEYTKISKYDLETSIEREFSGDIRKLLKSIVRVANNPARYYAAVIYKSMVGAGTDDRTLQRAIITRSEIDMVQIKEQFHQIYKKNLSDMIVGDTSGDYRKTLMALTA